MSKLANRLSRRSLIIGALALGLPIVLGVRLFAEEKKTTEPAPGLAKAMIGTWILVGTPDKVGEIPESGGRLKFFTGKHWNITESDPATHEVIFHHGGTYTLDGDAMAETIEYANQNTASYIKKTHQFKIKVEGDTYTQIGVGNDFNEVWKRLK